MSGRSESILPQEPLKLEKLTWLLAMGEADGDTFRLVRGTSGRRLRLGATFSVQKLIDVGREPLARYIVDTFSSTRPKLIPFVLENESLIKLAAYFLDDRTGSPASLYGYTDRIWRYSKRLGKTPDELIEDASDPLRAKVHVRTLEDYLAELKAEGLSPGRLTTISKAIRTLYRENDIILNLRHKISRKPIGRYRAPTPQELGKILDVANLREKVIVSLLALGGFREGTLVKLKYCHVKDDLETAKTPVHVLVPMDIVKGKYMTYDTFLAPEAVEYLQLYLDERRKGSPRGRIKAEVITDNSPLIRNSSRATPYPISEKQIYVVFHNLLFKAGLLKRTAGKRYDLKVHSLRKFFKTQLVSKGVPESYAEYMMGHVPDKYGYNDVESLGVDKLRDIYAVANLRIQEEPKASDRGALIKILRSLVKESGLDPDKVITWDAINQPGPLAEPHHSIVEPDDLEERQIRALSVALRESLKKEIIDDMDNGPKNEKYCLEAMGPPRVELGISTL